MAVRCCERAIVQVRTQDAKGRVVYGLSAVVTPPSSPCCCDEGGLPARTNTKLVEPLRELFKDQVCDPGHEQPGTQGSR